MAPMTRARSLQPGDVPTQLNAVHYAQRATAGLIISEATQISPEGKGYIGTPGMHSTAQRDGWRLVTEAVHRKGGYIFAQLWHVGRVSHSSMQPNGAPPVAPSSIAARDTSVYVAGSNGVPEFAPCSVPRALTRAEIHRVIDDFKRAAALAISAGFDGVELHGANGYLIDQFLRSTSNQRTDEYGGSKENRVRFLEQTAAGVAAEVGRARVGVRLSPFITLKDMADPDILDTMGIALERLDALGIAYVHLGEADWDDAPDIPDSYRAALRRRFGNSIIVTGRYTLERAQAVLQAGLVDLVGFGRGFIANPDLPHRLRTGLPLAPFQAATLYGGGSTGYTDYANHDETC